MGRYESFVIQIIVYHEFIHFPCIHYINANCRLKNWFTFSCLFTFDKFSWVNLHFVSCNYFICMIFSQVLSNFRNCNSFTFNYLFTIRYLFTFDRFKYMKICIWEPFLLLICVGGNFFANWDGCFWWRWWRWNLIVRPAREPRLAGKNYYYLQTYLCTTHIKLVFQHFIY